MTDDYDKTCHEVGIGGNCGVDCPVYLRGECESPPEPYVFLCLDTTGVSLTENRKYTLISKNGNLITVEDDDGNEKEFFADRFDLSEQDLMT